MKLLTFPLLLCLLFASAFAGDITDEEWIQNYFAELQKSSYDTRIAPEGDDGPGSPVKIKSSMYILDIDKVDDLNMDFTAQFYFRQGWNDSRLQYKDKTEDLILRSVDRIWTPDLFFIEEREGQFHNIIQPNVFCRIKPTGDVLFSLRLSVTFRCPMDLRSYPHDTQKCDISAESYGYRRTHINLDWNPDANYSPVGVSKDITLHNFDLIDFNSSSSHVKMTYGEYGRLQVHLQFKRKFGLFAIRLYIPFIILVVIALLSLWIRAEERCLRLSLLLVILYCTITASTEVNNSAPPAAYTKASDVWIGFCQSFIFAAFLEFIVVALISGRNNGDDSKSKGEILLGMDPEAKEQTLSSDSPKSTLSKLLNMFDARNVGNGRRNATAYRIDKACRIVFPIAFILFNIVYWSVYCCA